jgi:hypothetical protein
MDNYYDQQIAEAEQQLANLRSQMEDVKQRFLRLTAQFVATRYREKTESQVRAKPDLVKAAGPARLSLLKGQLQELCEQAPQFVGQFLDVPELWWHQQPGEQTYTYYGRRAPDPLDKAVRLAVGQLAPLLIECGLLPLNLSRTDSDNWREWDRSGNYHLPNGRWYYPQGLDWSDDMNYQLARYAELHMRALRIAASLQKLRDEKERAEAEEIWRNA